ncbi:MAG TPA: hypothetical protein DDW76_35640 [Cyanobacteria bacterium UBA11369]|nr:hypothetical protein [Cyanobacteria bacterium UBA11371]HBE36057.1 hypothetical protein [Cyanobacteria bacterium UBA11368]HBE53943.1 hypothetical protein [Cyanobacteria bacterium UBA11369]
MPITSRFGIQNQQQTHLIAQIPKLKKMMFRMMGKLRNAQSDQIQDFALPPSPKKRFPKLSHTHQLTQN